MGDDMTSSAAVAYRDSDPALAAAIEPLLSVRDVVMRFGGIVALDKVSFGLQKGHILGLIGPNGAGKTTLFNCLTRLYTPNSGTIEFEGRNILDRSANKIAGLGIARTFQNLALFRTLSVLDNVRVGGHARSCGDFFSDALRLPWVRREEGALEQAAWELIGYLNLRIAVSPICRSAPRSALSWHARWRRSQSCCCSTSRPEVSIITRSATSAH
jgi:branched-chain amino acid transport system ATP-binding protein